METQVEVLAYMVKVPSMVEFPYYFVMCQTLRPCFQVCTVEGAFTALEDVFPNLLRKRKKFCMAILCIVCFLAGIPMLTQVYGIFFACYLVLTLVLSFRPALTG